LDTPLELRRANAAFDYLAYPSTRIIKALLLLCQTVADQRGHDVLMQNAGYPRTT